MLLLAAVKELVVICVGETNQNGSVRLPDFSRFFAFSFCSENCLSFLHLHLLPCQENPKRGFYSTISLRLSCASELNLSLRAALFFASFSNNVYSVNVNRFVLHARAFSFLGCA
jgi:hypothetical protein